MNFSSNKIVIYDQFILWIPIVFVVFILTIITDNNVLAQEVSQNTKIYPHHDYMEQSEVFEVTVNGKSVFVEKHEPTDIEQGYPEGVEGELNYHYAHFAFDNEAKIEVKAKNNFKNYQLSPKSYNLKPNVDGNILTYKLDKNKDVVLKKGNDWLYLFANSVEKNIPNTNENNVLDITDEFDVDSEGKELNTYEIQKAIIDIATGPKPGGTLYFPKGVYKTGTLNLYSGVTIYLAPGAILKGSKDILDYPQPFGPEKSPPDRDYGYDYSLLKIHNVNNVSIKGSGIIEAPSGRVGRLKLVHIMASDDITIRDVTLRHGHGWMMPILNSENINISNINLISTITSNTDGINPDASENVTIKDNFIVSGDDAIAVKSTNFGNQLRGEVRDIVVADNTIMNVKSALKIGTETRSNRYDNIHFRNNDILTTDRAIVIYLRDGATIENIYFSNNNVEQAGGITDDNNKIIDIEISKRDREVIWQRPQWEKYKNNPGKIRNLVIENINISTDNTHFLEASKIQGFNKENNISGVTIRGIRVNGKKVKSPKMKIYNEGDDSINFLDIDHNTVKNIWFNGKLIDK